MSDVSKLIERLRRCAEEHKRDMQYGAHERITPLCIEVANFLEKEYINKNGEDK